MHRFARGTRANRYAPLGARRRSGVGQVTTAVHSREGTKFPRAPLPHPACGLCGGPFRLVRFARETRTNRYAPLGARHRSAVGSLRGCPAPPNAGSPHYSPAGRLGNREETKPNGPFTGLKPVYPFRGSEASPRPTQPAGLPGSVQRWLSPPQPCRETRKPGRDQTQWAIHRPQAGLSFPRQRSVPAAHPACGVARLRPTPALPSTAPPGG